MTIRGRQDGWQLFSGPYLVVCEQNSGGGFVLVGPSSGGVCAGGGVLRSPSRHRDADLPPTKRATEPRCKLHDQARPERPWPRRGLSGAARGARRVHTPRRTGDRGIRRARSGSDATAPIRHVAHPSGAIGRDGVGTPNLSLLRDCPCPGLDRGGEAGNRERGLLAWSIRTPRTVSATGLKPTGAAHRQHPGETSAMPSTCSASGSATVRRALPGKPASRESARRGGGPGRGGRERQARGVSTS